MKILRWVLAALVALYALYSALRVATNIAFKLGAYTPAGDMARLQPLMEATGWPVLAMWVLSVLLYLVSAVLLVRRSGRALVAFVVAWILDVGVVVLSQGPVLDQAFSETERTVMWAALGVLALIGAAIWWLGRGARTGAA